MHLIHTVRRLGRSGSGSLLVLGSLGLAIGAAGAMLSIYNALAVRTMRVADPNRLVSIAPMNGNAIYGIPMSTLDAVEKRQTSFTGLCGFSRGSLTVVIGGVAASHTNEAVTGSCYGLLGVRPYLGRLIDEHDAPVIGASSSVVVVSYAFWSTALGADRNIVGKTLSARGTPLTIIGVTPEGVGGFDTDQAPDLIVPLGIYRQLLNNPSAGMALYAVGRLKDHVSLGTATAEIRGMWSEVWNATNPLQPGEKPSRAATPDALRVESIARGLSWMRDNYGEPMAFLLTLAALLVILASVNVGGFLLARTTTRDRELAVMTALGASRLQIAVDVAGEAGVIAVGAAIIAIPVTWFASRVFTSLTWTRTLPTSLRTTPDPWVLLAISGIALVAGMILAGPSIAFAAIGSHPLAASTRSTTRVSSRWRRALVAGQVAVTMILVFAAALFARNLDALRNSDPGFDASSLAFANVALRDGQPRSTDPVAYFKPLLADVAAVPGVTNAALAQSFPTTQLYQVVGLTKAHLVPSEPGSGDVGTNYDYISPGFFQTIRASFRDGRDFDWSDDASHPSVVIVNQALADKLSPATSPLNQPLQIGTMFKPAAIVGVIHDASPGDYRLRDLPMAYLPLLQQDPRLVSSPGIIFRTAGALQPEQAIVRAIESHGRHRVNYARTVTAEVELFWLRERALRSVAVAFGLLSAIIGGLGLFALLDHDVSARRRELGVRLALGASAARIARLVIADVAVLVAIGVAIGVPAAFGAGHAARALLSNLSPYDGASIAVAAACLAAVILVAIARPGLRAARTRPADALRAD